MIAENRIIISLGSAECQALIELSHQPEVSLVWLGRCALSDLAKRYSRTDARLPVPATFPREHRRGGDQ